MPLDFDDNDNYYFYVLGSGSQGVRFYWKESDGYYFTNSAHKAYLRILKSEAADASGNVKVFGLMNDETAISNIAENVGNSQMYNIAGLHSSKAQKGLYIKNNKKYLLK